MWFMHSFIQSRVTDQQHFIEALKELEVCQFMPLFHLLCVCENRKEQLTFRMLEESMKPQIQQDNK